jgi:hypothetical protein
MTAMGLCAPGAVARVIWGGPTALCLPGRAFLARHGDHLSVTGFPAFDGMSVFQIHSLADCRFLFYHCSEY